MPRSMLVVLLISVAVVVPAAVVTRTSNDGAGDGDASALLNPGAIDLGGEGSSWYQRNPWLAAVLRVDVDTTDRQKGIAEIRRAIRLTEQKQYADAVAAYRTASELLPSLADWIAVFSAAASASAGDTAAVARRTADLDTTLQREWIWRSYVRAHANAGRPVRAIALAKEAAGSLPSPRRRAEAWRLAGELELERGNTAAARAAFSQALEESPLGDTSLEAARLLATLPGLTPTHHLQIGRIYLAWGNEKRGFSSLQRFLDAPSGDAATKRKVRYDIARAHFDAGRYPDAERIFRKVVAAAKGEEAAAALFFAGRAQYRRGDETGGRATFETVTRTYPGTPTATRALYMLADLDHDDGEVERAQERYRSTIRNAPASEYAGIAFMRLGITALSSGQPAEAVRIFREYSQAHTSGARHQQSVYWLGRAQAAAGASTESRTTLREARELEPFSFYGLRAAELLDESSWSSRLRESPRTAATAATAVARALDRYDILREVDWNEAAGFELGRVRSAFQEEAGALYTLAEGLHARDQINRGIDIGRELRRREGAWNERLLRIVYPLPFERQIVAHASARNIDPYFMAALIRQESAFNPSATSSAGAIGLMQVMPRTGRVLARSNGIRTFTPGLLRRPEVNLQLGSKYLADMIDAWGGRPDYVLAAYNAGPSRMARWRRFPEASDPDLFMERIPFEETRDYVRIVQLNARIYATLYGSAGGVSNQVQ